MKAGELVAHGRCMGTAARVLGWALAGLRGVCVCVCVCLCVRWMHGQTHGHAVVRCKAQSPFLGTRMNDEQACERGSHMFCTKAVVIVSSIHGHCLSDAAKTLDDQGIATPVANGQLAMLCYCLHMLCYCLHMLHAWATHPHAAQVCAYDAVIKISAST